MNWLIYPLSAKIYNLVIVCTWICLTVLYWWLSIFFEPLDGDLTRVGFFSENSFGWRQQQPSIAPELLKNYPINEADVVVIGDSFSASLVWQTKLIASGYKISTASITDTNLCNNLGEFLRLSGFNGKYLIIESIERAFQDRVNNCTQNNTTNHNYKTFAALPPPPTSRSLNYSTPNPMPSFNLGWAIRTLTNETQLYNKAPEKGELKSFGNADVATLDGCSFFSNKLCKYGLFYNADFHKKPFGSIDRILSINHNLQQTGIRVIWLVIPDKATVYLGPGKFNKYPYVNIWNELTKRLELTAPNLSELFTRQAKQIKDFYAPNNTHMSVQGSLYLGELVLAILNKNNFVGN